jgi:GH35 family endo-1,4-beta-xylanase
MDDVQLLDPDGNNLIANGTFEENADGWTKPSWHEYEIKTVADPDQEGGGGGMTEEVKKDTLTWALNNFISGMMKACNGKVKAWDVVNEPMSDAAPAELKTAGRDGDPKKCFFWQDHLGKDYARLAVKLARKAASDSVQLKLFINDYNLEAAYNKNAKLQGLIDMIKYWESDGVTKIDGIGSQMHVTYSMNPKTQAANEEAYVNHLKMMAATGKLVRISELDMGIADAEGHTINTADVTEEQQQLMAQYYKFIVSKYFEIIPANQQYGICNWGLQDSPKGSGWRADEPIGLWDANWVRKPAYVGFCEGLKQE